MQSAVIFLILLLFYFKLTILINDDGKFLLVDSFSISLRDENYLDPAKSNLSAYLQCLEKA